jgi:hypothetical protein
MVMSKIKELTKGECELVTGGENHGQETAAAVHFAQDFAKSYGVQVGPEVSYFARNGLLPPR